MSEPGSDVLARVRSLPRMRVGVGAVIVLVLVALGAAVLMGAVTTAATTTVVTPGATSSADPTAAAAESTVIEGAAVEMLMVHVLGAVRTPGLYELGPSARMIDAIAAAGGLADGAEVAGVNLARAISDGEQIVVPRIGEQLPAPSTTGAVAGPISLATATVEQLDQLPRVGPATAKLILDWRAENGPFTSVDDLLQIPGIGEKTVAAFRDLVVP